MGEKRPVCAHYASSYLPLTENWIHKLLINHKTFDPIFLTRTKKNLELFPGVPIISLDDFSFIKRTFQLIFFKTVGYFLFFRKACLEHNVKILHVHFGYHGVKMLHLKRVLGIPIVISFYGDDAFSSHFIRGNGYRNLFREADKILVLGPYMKEQLVSLGCAESKLAIHHLGIEVNKILFRKRSIRPDEPIRFLIVSSFLEKKGVDIALRALGELNRHYNFTVDIIGDGPLRSVIEAIVREFGLQSRVTMHGYKSYNFFIELAYQCHVFIQASRTTSDNRKEGTPMAIADVMATGMTVIATRHSDIPELVLDGKTGYLANENDIADLVKCLKKLLDSPDSIPEMGAFGRSHIEYGFNIITQTERLEAHFVELINAVPKSSRD